MMSSPRSLYLKISICYLSNEQSAYGDLHLLRLMSHLMHLEEPQSYLGWEYLCDKGVLKPKQMNSCTYDQTSNMQRAKATRISVYRIHLSFFNLLSHFIRKRKINVACQST